MTVVDAPVRLGIDLGWNFDTCVGACDDFMRPLLEQMSSGKYDECATMPLPRNVQAWEAEHRTARKRAWKAQAQGYAFRQFDKRDGLWREVMDINTSRPYRQGRPMADGYMGPQDYDDKPFPCDLHAIRYYGVVSDEPRLVAYLWMYRAGDLALVSQVLGHADHEANGIMYLLFREALAAEGAIAPGVCVYNRWDSGTDGLRFLKARIGFERTAVEWLP